jgi:hypothetical protein
MGRIPSLHADRVKYGNLWRYKKDGNLYDTPIPNALALTKNLEVGVLSIS